MIPQWLASPGWAQIVKALLHTLWQAAAVSALLGLTLRRSTNPLTRYRCSLGALAAVLVIGLLTWAVLNPLLSSPARISSNSVPSADSLSKPAEVVGAGQPPAVVVATATDRPPASSQWTAWLALVWLAGAGLMLARAGAQVAGAERLRRSCRPLEDSRVGELVAEARRAVGLARQVRVGITDRLTSPAVVGVIVPTLILPLALITTLTPEQIRFVLLHELAHIRRGDYLANVFQLFAEALLFFNPAVWWISHQVRREREACCDALATELSGTPTDYARTLVRVAENVLNPPPVAAPAFGDRRREPSSLNDRVQRLLVPGYRPALRLTWRAMLTALLLGGALLVLSAVGTRITVAAILTPQQRIERVEKLLVEQGDTIDETKDSGTVEFSGRVRTEDGSPLPAHTRVEYTSRTHGSLMAGTIESAAGDGSFKGMAKHGYLALNLEATGFAPCSVGPFDARATNRVEGVELVLRRGFTATIQLADADSGAPIPAAPVRVQFWPRQTSGTSFRPLDLKTDPQGRAILANCADLPVEITCNVPGHEIIQQRFESVKAAEPLRVIARRGLPVAGVVLDKFGGKPISGATIRILRQQSPSTGGSFGWDDEQRILARTGSEGRFAADQLRRDSRYWIGVSAPGHESFMFGGIVAGETNLLARLGPELVVHGRVTGNLDAAKDSRGRPDVRYTVIDPESGVHNGRFAASSLKDGVLQFEFTNRVAGPVELHVAGFSFDREVDAPVADWHIELTNGPATTGPAKMRQIVIRFRHPSGAPEGAIDATVPCPPDNPGSYYHKQIAIQKGEARLELPVGAPFIEFAPDRRTMGYWFERIFMATNIPDGDSPMVIEVPVIPAGIIIARARNTDGTPAENLLFSVDVLKPSPLVEKPNALYDFNDSFSDNEGPRQFISPPMPLGGTYRVVGWRGNAFCFSGPIHLTEEKPEAEVNLQFPAERSLEGRVVDANGKPVRGADVAGTFSLDNHSFGLKPTFTDEKGHFQLEHATPGGGTYSLEICNCAGWSSERYQVDPAHQPLLIRLKPALKITGVVVESGTGFVIPSVEIRAWDVAGNLPNATTHADAEGHFEFNTLGDATYQLLVEGANFADLKDSRASEFRAGRIGPLTLEVIPVQGSHLVPRPPVGGTTNGLEDSTAQQNDKLQPQDLRNRVVPGSRFPTQ